MDAAAAFERRRKADPEEAASITAIGVLTSVIKESDVQTIQGLHDLINNAISSMPGILSVKSACELFERFITLNISDAPDDFDTTKRILLDRADIFKRKVSAHFKTHTALNHR